MTEQQKAQANKDNNNFVEKHVKDMQTVFDSYLTNLADKTKINADTKANANEKKKANEDFETSLTAFKNTVETVITTMVNKTAKEKLADHEKSDKTPTSTDFIIKALEAIVQEDKIKDIKLVDSDKFTNALNDIKANTAITDDKKLQAYLKAQEDDLKKKTDSFVDKYVAIVKQEIKDIKEVKAKNNVFDLTAALDKTKASLETLADTVNNKSGNGIVMTLAITAASLVFVYLGYVTFYNKQCTRYNLANNDDYEDYNY